MTEAPGGTALETAYAWLDGVVANTGDPLNDAGVWFLTHESWCCQIAAAYFGPDNADVGRVEDVRTLDDWPDLVRYAVLRFREGLPMTLQSAGVGDAVGMTQIQVVQSVNGVQVVFNDTGLDPGYYNMPIGSRVGFAVTALYEVGTGWTIAGLEADWRMPAWWGEIDAAST